MCAGAAAVAAAGAVVGRRGAASLVCELTTNATEPLRVGGGAAALVTRGAHAVTATASQDDVVDDNSVQMARPREQSAVATAAPCSAR